MSWDGRSPDGSRVPAGVYEIRWRVGESVITRRFVLLP